MRLFGTDGIRGKVGTYPITKEGARDLGAAFVTFLGGNPTIILGADTRESSSVFEEEFANGAIGAGGNVKRIGVLPTNAVSFAVRAENASGGCMISASHNPASDNGFKFFNSRGCKISDDDQVKLADILVSEQFTKGTGSVESLVPYEKYIESLTSECGNVKVAIDAGNGAASTIVRDVFSHTNAAATILGDNPNGRNVNESGAMHVEKLRDVVTSQKLDVGFAFDGDADRLVVVDDAGSILEGDEYLAIVAPYLKARGGLRGSAVVVTEYSNAALDAFLQVQGIRTLRVAVGDKFISEALLKNGWILGAENSGHIVMTKYAYTADAVRAALVLLEVMSASGKKLSELSRAYKPYPQVQLSVSVAEKKPLEQLPKTTAAISEANKELNGEGRVFVRYSGTENVLRVLVEGRKQEDINRLAESIAAAVRSEQ